MLLRTPWIVGQVGLGPTLGIICASFLVAVITGLSFGSIIANGVHHGPGGAYQFVSRTLGRPIGSAVGILFWALTSTAMGVSFIGGGEVIRTYVLPAGTIVADLHNSTRLYGVVLTLMLAAMFATLRPFLLNHVGQTVIILVLAILPFMIAGFGLDAASPAPSVAISAAGMIESDPEISLATAFATFYPCISGIMVACNKSGNIRHATRNLPRGTQTSLAIAFVCYMTVAILSHFAVPMPTLRSLASFPAIDAVWPHRSLGIIMALLLSAGAGLHSAMGAQRILRGLVLDNVGGCARLLTIDTPTGAGRIPSPMRILLATTLVGGTAASLGRLDWVVPAMTSAYMVVYAILNTTALLAHWTRSTAWRPLKGPWWRRTHPALAATGIPLSLAMAWIANWWFSTAVAVLLCLGTLGFALLPWATRMGYGYDVWRALLVRVVRLGVRALASLEPVDGDASGAAWRMAPRVAVLTGTNAAGSEIALVEIACGLASATGDGFAMGFAVEPSSQLHAHASYIPRFGNSPFLGHAVPSPVLTVAEPVSGPAPSPPPPVEMHTAAELSSLYAFEISAAQARLDSWRTLTYSSSRADAIGGALQAAGAGAFGLNAVLLAVPGPAAEDGSEWSETVARIDALRLTVIAGKLPSTLFRNPTPPSSIDVYWATMDGNLLLHLAYLLVQRRGWETCPIRVFLLTDHHHHHHDDDDIKDAKAASRSGTHSDTEDDDDDDEVDDNDSESLTAVTDADLVGYMRRRIAALRIPVASVVLLNVDHATGDLDASTQVRLNATIRAQSPTSAMVVAHLKVPSRSRTEAAIRTRALTDGIPAILLAHCSHGRELV
ncbi:hypothetical protein BC828DRAFT_387194 [Blastocladiella britannica]|nr:hypothetical protein BC828DRAFT_387194 [Blastocladiella britannica]